LGYFCCVINQTNPYLPEVLSQYNNMGGLRGIIVRENIAYISEETLGMVIVNVTNPIVPITISSFNDGGEGGGIFLLENLVYIADFRDSLEIIDISNVNFPVKIGQFQNTGFSIGLAVNDLYAFVADFDAGMEVISIHDPTKALTHRVQILFGMYFLMTKLCMFVVMTTVSRSLMCLIHTIPEK